MVYTSRFLQRAWFRHTGYGWRKDLKTTDKTIDEDEEKIQARLIEEAMGPCTYIGVGTSIGIGIVIGVHRCTYSIMPEWFRYKGDVDYKRQKHHTRIPEECILVSIDVELSELLTHPCEQVRSAAKLHYEASLSLKGSNDASSY